MQIAFLLLCKCSKTCGRGVRRREVVCKSSATEILPESWCSSSPRPETQEGCVLGRCPKNNRLQWITSSWSEVRVKFCFVFSDQLPPARYHQPASFPVAHKYQGLSRGWFFTSDLFSRQVCALVIRLQKARIEKCFGMQNVGKVGDLLGKSRVL